MTFSAAYLGLSAVSASWHSLGVLSTLVGMLLIRIFDHLIFAVMRGVPGVTECLRVFESFEAMDSEIWLWAEVSCWSVLECPPVRTRFPFTVHLAEDMWICE